jgi:hypothetical protein
MASCANAVHADVQFFDGTFDDNDWVAIIIHDETPGHNAMFTAGQVTDGGDPGPYRRVTHVWTGLGGFMVGHLQVGAGYNPSVDGAISGVDYSFNLTNFVDTGGLSVRYWLLLYQNDSYYVSGGDNVFIDDPLWKFFGQDDPQTQHDNLTASCFSIVVGSGPPHPDFSAGGTPILFGYASGNGVADNSTERTESGIDNWSVTVHCKKKLSREVNR